MDRKRTREIVANAAAKRLRGASRSPSPPPIGRNNTPPWGQGMRLRSRTLGPVTPPPGTPPPADRRRRLSVVRRSETPRTPSPVPPAAASIVVTLYEGAAVPGLLGSGGRRTRGSAGPAGYAEAFVDKCTTYTPNRRIAEKLKETYIRNEFTVARTARNMAPGSVKIKSPGAVYAILATGASTGELLGYVKGTVYTVYPGLPDQSRVLVVDILCGQGRSPTRGIGSILLQETELYARSLGANLIMLFSVKNPATVGFYSKKGFQRAANACRPGSALNLAARRSPPPGTPNAEYVAAMQGAFYKNLDDFNDTVVMTKCVQGSGRQPSRQVSFAGPKYAALPSGQSALGRYGSPAPGSPFVRL